MVTPKQRVKTALDHQEPDRIPVALGGGPYGIVDDLYFKLLQYLNLGDTVQPFRIGHSISYMDDRLLDALGVDTRYVWPGASPSSPVVETDDPDRFLDGYGQTWVRAKPYYYAVGGILEEATTVAEIDEMVTWPDPTEAKWTDGVRERAQYLHENTDCYVIARMVTSHGVYQTACDLRGTEKFLLDMAMNPEFAHALVKQVTQTIEGLLTRYIAECGDYIDMIELPGDDYAGNTNLIMSPKMFRSYFKPAIQQLIDTIRSYRSDIKIMLHSDGAITPLLPDFIELGIDVVHPLEPLPAMNLSQIKEEYGDRIAFLGGIDIAHAMPGSHDDVVAEVQERIQQLGRGGGYVLAPSNHLQADVPPENVITLCETARQFGKYPLHETTNG